MPNISSLSKFLKADHVKDGDIITFVDAGIVKNKEFKNAGVSEFKDILEITVEFNTEKKTYSPNATTIGLLSKAWGSDTDRWIGKRARLYVVPAPNGKDSIIGKPVEGINL